MKLGFFGIGRSLAIAVGAAGAATSCGASDDHLRSKPVETYHLGCTQPDATHSVSCPCATTDDLRNIGDAPFLERMTVNPVATIDFAPLARLTHLHALIIDADRPIELHGLQKLGGIRELTVATADVDWKPVAKMALLDKLVLVDNAYGRRKKSFELSFVGDLANLQVLDISHVEVTDLSWLARLEKLKRLKLRCASCDTPEGVARYRTDNPALSLRESHGTTVDYGRIEPSGAICDIDPKACPRPPECQAPIAR